jgi:hypothetical protein
MSKAALFACSLSIVGDGQNLQWAPAPTTPIGSAASPAVTTPFVFSGAALQEYAVPPGSVGFVIVPSFGNTAALTLLFASADTGGPIATNAPSPCDWEGSASPPANIWIHAAAACSGLIYFF